MNNKKVSELTVLELKEIVRNVVREEMSLNSSSAEGNFTTKTYHFTVDNDTLPFNEWM